MKQTIEKILISAEHKIVALLAVVVIVVSIPTALFAWGPDRPTYTIENPADHITFNSITNNPNYGDERNFVTIKDVTNSSPSAWVDEIAIENNKEYYVRMYVHNNAGANLNLVAENVTARFNLPDYRAERIQIDGYLSSTNATPTEIWDQAVFTNSTDFSLDYIEGSALYTNNVFTNGTALTDGVIAGGSLLGYSQLNGQIPGCFQYSGLVTFKVKAVTYDFVIEKLVRINGLTDKTFFESVNVKPGDKVDYRIYFQNNGGTQLKDVIIRDVLPAGLTYVEGSTVLLDSNGLHDVNDGITTAGINIGGYLPEGDAYVRFTAEVTDNDSLELCGNNTLTNTANAITSVGTKSDDATVNADKECGAKPDECKQGIPVGDVRCTVTPQTTKTPTELPKTGIGESVMTFLGLGFITASAIYYFDSRRKLHSKFAHHHVKH